MSLPPVQTTTAPPIEFNFRDYLRVLQRRKEVFLLVFLVTAVVGIVSASRGNPVYQTSAKMLVRAASYSLSVIDSNNPIGAMLAASQPDSVESRLEQLQSPGFMDQAYKEAKIEARPEVMPPSASFEEVNGTNVILVTVTGGDPNQCAALANTIVKLHVAQSEEATNAGINQTIEFVQSERSKAEKQLAEIDQRVLKLQQAHPGISPGAEREARAGEYAAVLARVLELRGGISSTRGQIASLRVRLAQQPQELKEESTRDNPRRAKLKEKLDELRFQRMDLLREFRPTSRAVMDLDRQMARLQEELEAEPAMIRVERFVPNPALVTMQTRLEELESSLQEMQRSYQAAAAEFEVKKGSLAQAGPFETQLARLSRDRDAIQGAYNMLADRLRDLQIRKNANLHLWTVKPLAPASVPGAPLPDRKSKNMMMAVVLALLLALSTVFLQEFLDDRLNAPEEVERAAGLRTLARVPLMAADEPRLIAALPGNSPVAESYRALRASIGFAAVEAPVRRLQITSASPHEGKSTTAVNLATAMARDGKRVVLIDADLRSPTLHRVLHLPGTPGLSDVLAGSGRAVELLHETEVENLRVLTAGTHPPNPAELLGSEAFSQALEALEGDADVLIVDTPPCMPVTDPVIVAARMDGVVLVVQVGETRKAALRQTVELLSQARARVLGVVFNRLEAHRGGHYYYAYSYGYGSGERSGRRTRKSANGRNGKVAAPELETGGLTPVAAAKEEEEA